MISLLSCFSWVNRHDVFHCWQKVSVLQVVKIPFCLLQAQKSQGRWFGFFRRVEGRAEAVGCSPTHKVILQVLHHTQILCEVLMDSQIFSVQRKHPKHEKLREWGPKGVSSSMSPMTSVCSVVWGKTVMPGYVCHHQSWCRLEKKIFWGLGNYLLFLPLSF